MKAYLAGSGFVEVEDALAPAEVPQLPDGWRRSQFDGAGDAILGSVESAWEQGLIGSMLMTSRMQSHPAVPGYDPTPNIEKRYEQHAPYLLSSTSPEQLAQRKQVLERQMQNRERLDEAGFILSLPGEAVSALGDPLTYVGLGWSLRGTTALSAIGRGAVQQGAGTALSTAIANAFNPTGSTMDIIENAFLSAAAGGVFNLGATTGGAGKAQRWALDRGYRNSFFMLTGEGGADLLDSVFGTDFAKAKAGGSLSAAKNPYFNTPDNPEGIVKTAIGIEKFPMSPMVRAIGSGVDAISQFVQDLVPMPFFLEKHMAGEGHRMSAQVATTLKYETRAADLVRETDALYGKHRGVALEGFVDKAKLWAGDMAQGRGEKLSPTEFRERITDQVFSGKFDDAIPEVNAAAKQYAKFYDDVAEQIAQVGFFKKEDLDAKRIWNLVDGKIEERYGGPMIWDLYELRRNKDGFMDDWRSWQSRLPEDHAHRKIPAEKAWQAVTRDRRYTPIDDDMTGLASSLKARELRVPYQVFRKWLARDAEGLARFYARTTGTDIEIGRRSGGDVSMRDRINAAKEAAMQKLDEAIQVKDANAIRQVDDRAVGPAELRIRSMHAEQQRLRAKTQKKYAEFIDDLARSADPEAEAKFAAELRREFDDGMTQIEAKTREDMNGLADKYGLKRSDVQGAFDAMQKAGQDMADVRDAVRGTLGQPDDPMGLVPRTVRVAKQISNMTMLTGALASVPDIGAMVLRFGLRDTFGTIFDDLGKRFRGDVAQKAMKRELEKAGTTLEMVMQSRAAMMTDLTDAHGRFTKFERAVDDANSLFFTLSLTTGWTDMVHQWVGALVLDEVLSLAQKAKAGKKLSQGDVARMARSGIDEAMLARIADMPAEKIDGIWLPDTDKWTDRGAVGALRRAILEDTDRIVVKSNKAEQPNWVSGPIGSLIGQYKGFAVAVTNRVLIPALQLKDQRALVGVVSMIGAGYLVDQIRHAQSPMGNMERPFMTQIGRAIERSGVLGWLTDAGRSLDTLTDGRFGYGALIGDKRKEPMLSILGPSVDQAGKLLNVAQGAAGLERWSADHARDMRGLIMLNRTAHLDFGFDAMQRAFSPETLATQGR